MSDTLQPIEVFFSYADEDELLRNELEKHLSLLRRQGLIAGWHHRLVPPGTDLTRAIDEHLERALIILLLISADFLNSNYRYGIEMQRALQRHQTKQARVLPILLRPVNWKDAPFAHLQVLPSDGLPITKWENQDEAFANVVAGIYQAIEDFTHPSVSTSTTTRTVLKSPAGHTVLGTTDVTVGRAPDNTYMINDSQVSGHHAVIRQHGQGYEIFDLKSTNKTFVNGQALSPEKPQMLKRGDSVRVGTTTFEYTDGILVTPIAASPAPVPQASMPVAPVPVNLSQSAVMPPPPPRSTPTPIFAPPSPTDQAMPKFPPKGHGTRSSRALLSRGSAFLLIGLAVLVIAGLFLYTFISDNQVAQQNANATATARTLASNGAAATASAQAQANLTGTATVTSSFPRFTTVAFHDQLTSGTDSQWAAASACEASSSGYQVSIAQNSTFQFCKQLSSTFNDFAFQVDMTIHSGDCGGLVFRGFDNNNYYVVSVCSNGKYDLGRIQNGNPRWAYPLDNRPFSSAIQQGTGSQNIVAVVVQNNTFNLYVNDLTKTIDSFTDSVLLGQGFIGLVADDFTNPTSVVYTNAVVWT